MQTCRCGCGENLSEKRKAWIPGHWVRKVVMPLDERFWGWVNRSENDDCWLWRGRITRAGYGQFSIQEKMYQAHRVAYALTYGVEWLKGDQAHPLRHTCDTKACVRPDHLIPGTSKQNAQEASERGLLPRGDQHWTRRTPEKLARGSRHGKYIRGEAHHKAKLTEDDVRQIRTLHATGQYTYAQLATLFPVNASMVSFIVRRIHWSHVI